MIKSYFLISELDGSLLAEVRTDGTKYQLLDDVTGGEIDDKAGGSMEKLTQVSNRSSHISIIPSQDTGVGTLGFFLNTGDTVEITTDSQTATLNGRLLDAEEMKALFESLAEGEVAVSHGSRLEDAKPIESA